MRNVVLLSVARPSDLLLTECDKGGRMSLLRSGYAMTVPSLAVSVPHVKEANRCVIDCLVERPHGRDREEASGKATQRLGLQSDSLRELNPANCSELRSRPSSTEPWCDYGIGRASIRAWASPSQWAQLSCACIPVHRNREILHVCWGSGINRRSNL